MEEQRQPAEYAADEIRADELQTEELRTDELQTEELRADEPHTDEPDPEDAVQHPEGWTEAGAIEAVLFSAGDPVSLDRLAAVTGCTLAAAKRILEHM